MVTMARARPRPARRPIIPPAERAWRCKVCGCTDQWGCDEGCYWVAENLCSACVSDEIGVDA
jgi:hypothetical protein